MNATELTPVASEQAAYYRFEHWTLVRGILLGLYFAALGVFNR